MTEAFKESFLDFDIFDVMLSDVCDIDNLPTELYIDYTNYKLSYMIEGNKRFDEFKMLVALENKIKSTNAFGDVSYKYFDHKSTVQNKKRLILEQRKSIANFKAFISKIPLLS